MPFVATQIFQLFQGSPVTVRYRSGLRDTAGNPAHAATFIRQRLIVLDTALKQSPDEHQRILLHEFFHFVWVRLGNPRRLAWEALLRTDRAKNALGEAGWSSEWRKDKLSADDAGTRSRRWREYCCESFCDTGAWMYGTHVSEVTLSHSGLRARAKWFITTLGDTPFPI